MRAAGLAKKNGNRYTIDISYGARNTGQYAWNGR